MRLFLSFSALILLSCAHSDGSGKVLFSFPKKIKEVSGIHLTKNSDLIWTIEDSGNANVVYGISAAGEVVETIQVDVTNTDWEDITSDTTGNLYLGDFGNNDNDRKDLCIYKINASDVKNGEIKTAYKVAFNYPQQTEFPPKKKELFYDCEGFFEHNGFFYLFTKNRSKGFDGTTFLYKIPNKEGNHNAVLMGKFVTCPNFNSCAITSAAISQDGQKVVILSHDQLWLFEKYQNDDFLTGTVTQLKLDDNTQKEAVCFKDNETLLIADEKDKHTGGKLYQYSIQKLKTKS